MQNRCGASYSWIYFLEDEILFKKEENVFSLNKSTNEHTSRDKSMSLPLHPSSLASSQLKHDSWESMWVFSLFVIVISH